MKKYNKEHQRYENVSRYQMLSKIMNEIGLIGTLIAYDESKDMYRVRLNVDSSNSMICWYTDDEIKEYYHKYKDRQKKKKEQHDKYIKQKKNKKRGEPN